MKTKALWLKNQLQHKEIIIPSCKVCSHWNTQKNFTSFSHHSCKTKIRRRIIVDSLNIKIAFHMLLDPYELNVFRGVFQKFYVSAIFCIFLIQIGFKIVFVLFFFMTIGLKIGRSWTIARQKLQTRFTTYFSTKTQAKHTLKFDHNFR